MRTAIPTRALIGVLAVALAGACPLGCGGSHGDVVSTRRSSSVTTGSTGASPGAPSTVVLGPEPPRSLELQVDDDDDDTLSPHSVIARADSDADYDNDSRALLARTFYDGDDGALRGYGQPAGAADERAVTAVVKHYDAAAFAADGAGVCALMYSIYAEAIPEDYGRGAGPAYSRGNSCAVVTSKLFRHDRAQVPSTPVVVAVRVEGNQARALVGSRTVPAAYLPLIREHGAWKVDSLFALSLP